ncbi:hypothetical protein J1605_000831 [Eschrichtius robustus]|uniref:Uncharacterized protein n=1 Tax=Eschrichtius robustus TaxID=9764 RepID=A0AB34GNQ7_ESCRO|nr:hypothetical protein J1605_000831 [Eschrichtius robustus]
MKYQRGDAYETIEGRVPSRVARPAAAEAEELFLPGWPPAARLGPIAPGEELLVWYNGEDNPEIAAAIEEERASARSKRSSPKSRKGRSPPPPLLPAAARLGPNPGSGGTRSSQFGGLVSIRPDCAGGPDAVRPMHWPPGAGRAGRAVHCRSARAGPCRPAAPLRPGPGPGPLHATQDCAAHDCNTRGWRRF